MAIFVLVFALFQNSHEKRQGEDPWGIFDAMEVVLGPRRAILGSSLISTLDFLRHSWASAHFWATPGPLLGLSGPSPGPQNLHFPMVFCNVSRFPRKKNQRHV